jgi:COP9 signalosome complex subunit 1
LYAKKTDYRGDLIARAMQAGNDIMAANRKVLLRMRLYVSRTVFILLFLPWNLEVLLGPSNIHCADEMLTFFFHRQQADLIVKPPKGHPQQYGMVADYYPE